MDGLMIDTEPLHLLAFNEVFKKYEKFLSAEENTKRYVGVSDKDAITDMVIRFHLPLSSNELASAKQTEYKKLIQEQLVPLPGLIGLLKNLQDNGYKTAIASGSTKEEIEMVIKRLGIAPYIEIYISADQVQKGKPAPDIFLKAAEKLGVKPNECLVLEDAPKGVQAAKSAGMICFAIPSLQTQGQDFSLADKVLNNLSQVFQII
ncbi:MAG: HAD family hydrolase [uncultured bacterium]|uniref:HAD-superfamily hydrolase, subfamily IA, variant 3 n=1 Tax=Candidatus Daviesbacteria bacterium GW2011_GWC2_40_12 TaxID=1618431 RepID=A0A0G0QNS1_9BACT|nr:MAG: HAD family hydrolase [uncultured bacterium]KKQ84977.1 MAG: HAD-superfamily hydrolase, subfamily IA, variant 3 [Candidatus Daviesbacteria bacterium GW2011_GWF2_38_7]KKR17010.1 MAG: HAD-superfamily hydrolase, subfamily IA, variant 3 [Candidatus Daviesbacteria bacterium GW2011_GWA2_39_33]KKR24099.1 MAG: HAD-superfamily hydrolase, subfamily IA, variant 3 [Candidatus Daviesbacteria bacterium GW2011_GWB1_39_5]KKR42074.1 MAG: HAD-superfamily hydrolase, subfamily IA, variant 3 [Candidatus Davie